MKSKIRIVLPIIAAGLLVAGAATVSLGQSRSSTTIEPRLRGNPYRDAGGSCVYDKKGRVVFAPNGRNCPDAMDHLSSSRAPDPPIVASYPPRMRGELRKLLGDHHHIAQEIARLTQALETRNYAVAMTTADKIREELTGHRAREESFFESMAPTRTAR